MRIIVLLLLVEYVLTNIEEFLVLVPIGDYNLLTYYYYLPAIYGEYLELTIHLNHIIYVLILTYILNRIVRKEN